MHLAYRSRPGRKNDAYLEFVREHGSCVGWKHAGYDELGAVFLQTGDREGGGYPGVVSHHVRAGGHGGVGLKPSDYRTVPLTDSEHRELHQKGEKSFWLSRDVDPDRVIIALLCEWLGPKHSSEITVMTEESADVRELASKLVDYAEKVG